MEDLQSFQHLSKYKLSVGGLVVAYSKGAQSIINRHSPSC
jgi:hypothetical protein